MSDGSDSSGVLGLINGGAGSAQSSQGVTTKAFALNLAVGLGLFLFEITGFFLLKSLDIGRRIYQPKSYLVQRQLRVDLVPVNPFRWIRRIFTIEDDELKSKCGLDGYLFIRFIRAMIIIFLPLMVIVVTILLPINYNDGKGSRVFIVGHHRQTYNVTGLDTLSWQNVAPTQTNRYWAHLVCALLVIGWTLYRIYREKIHFISVRQQFLMSPEHRLKASARTIMVSNIPREYQSQEALKALYDIFVDDDDRRKLYVWLNRDYGPLRAATSTRRKLCNALEKEELRMLRLVNKQRRKEGDIESDKAHSQLELPQEKGFNSDVTPTQTEQTISQRFEEDSLETESLWCKYLKPSLESQLTVVDDGAGFCTPASTFKFWARAPSRKVPRIAWLRAEIARLNTEIADMLLHLDDETRFKRQNSAFIQFDRQLMAHMACSLVSHHQVGRMDPRFIDAAPHEIIWKNCGITSIQRFVRTCIALLLFLAIIILWGIPTTFLGFLSQLDSLRATTSWLDWLRTWPSWIISLISGPITSILLTLLIQLVVPALCRKLAVLVGSPTRSKREVVTQEFYFAFLFIELVLVTSISSGLVATVPTIIENPSTIATTLATNLPKAANYFFNYLIIQALSFSGSVLFQYLRLLYITTIWPWFTQTPRQEAWLQTTIPHQMWGNVYPIITNFAAIGLIYSITAPLMLIFASVTFVMFWFAYRHNYYYVQRNKVDSHGRIFQNALSQLFAGIYVLEITLIGLFFLVRDSNANVACTAQAIIMIVALAFTAAFHFLLQRYLQPLYEFLPVTLEDRAADAERRRFSDANKAALDSIQDETDKYDSVETSTTSNHLDETSTETQVADDTTEPTAPPANDARTQDVTTTAIESRKALRQMLKRRNKPRPADAVVEATATTADLSRRQIVANELKESISGFVDKLTDLSPAEREAVLNASYQDPVTRELPPVIWIPQDPNGVSDDIIRQTSKYGKQLHYSNKGAYLTKTNKCEVIQPAPDVRPDWLLDWSL